ncbi:MAG: ABC transporter ATP-binding protein [Armatimonadota bacterium]
MSLGPDIAISLEGVGKQFAIGQAKPSLKTVALNLLRGQLATRRFWALRDISLEIPRGQFLGVVGPNGSGKSTLLSLIAGILRPTAGHVHTQGRICTLLELGAGFHPDLTGRDNIFLNAAILGIPQRRIAHAMDAIVEFAELADFIDEPIRAYSSGMKMRLGFAIAVNVEADILLVDEVLAVGDERFQQKCYRKAAELHSQGRTLVFVSHDLPVMERFCQRAVWLEKGELRADGAPSEVLPQYVAQSSDAS